MSRRLTKARTLLVLTAASAIIPLIGLVEPASAAGLRVSKICAENTEDSSVDELYVKKNDKTTWGPSSITQGTCKEATFALVSDGDRITLYDQDGGGWDYDDTLGTITIRGVGWYEIKDDSRGIHYSILAWTY